MAGSFQEKRCNDADGLSIVKDLGWLGNHTTDSNFPENKTVSNCCIAKHKLHVMLTYFLCYRLLIHNYVHSSCQRRMTWTIWALVPPCPSPGLPTESSELCASSPSLSVSSEPRTPASAKKGKKIRRDDDDCLEAVLIQR